MFNTHDFLFFFVAFFAVYVCLAKWFRLQNAWLLLASYFFYANWDIRFLSLIILSTVLDYGCGLLMDRGELSGRDRARLSAILLLAILSLIGIPWHQLYVAHGLHGITPARILAGIGNMPSTSRWLCFGALGLVIAGNVAYSRIRHASHDSRRFWCLLVSVCGNLGILAIFKYYNFFIESFTELSHRLIGSPVGESWTLSIILPVGISFYTFQTMSYTIDVYRRQMPACPKLLDFAVYVSFFPQLVAGPIERASRLLPIIQSPRRQMTFENMRLGGWLVVWGLFKKVVVADNMAPIVQSVFSPYDHGELSQATLGATMLVGLYAFALQIYGDFSGYSDIARGLGELLGIPICRNFDVPYVSVSPSEFWRRWHISLSTWLRDYLYIPLGGNRGPSWFVYRNLMLTMILGGLWHGASWTFVLWGFYHGALLCIYRLTGLGEICERQTGLVRFVIGVFFFHLTCLGWLLFRAQNIGTVTAFLSGMIWDFQADGETVAFATSILKYSWMLFVYDAIVVLKRVDYPVLQWSFFPQMNAWIAVCIAVITLSNRLSQEFIYFAF